MTRREPLIAALLIVFGTVVGIGIVEAGYRIYQREFPPLYSWDQRIMFFDGPGSIFRNVGDIFTYVPKGDIFSRTIYFSESSYSTEYAYKFKTNNFGLVQDTDLVPGMRSILLLGDSFTEGQGAEPWFRQIAPQIERLNYQPINGGLLGTGFPQWWSLKQFLSANEISISKLIVIFISDDLQRTEKWNFLNNQLNCLRSINRCAGNEGYFRLPPSTELAHWVAKIRTAREHLSIKARVESALPASYQVYRFLQSVGKRSQPTPPENELVTAIVNKMVKSYGRENVLFIQLPQKEELKGTTLPDGLLMRKIMRNVDAQFVDGISLCRLDKYDFFVRDGHPNQQGYSKIGNCVTQILDSFLAKDR
jgi:hypothetical protein